MKAPAQHRAASVEPEVQAEELSEEEREFLEASGQSLEGRSLWQDARVRFFRNKAAVAGLIVLILVSLFAIFGLWITPHEPEFVDFSKLGSVETEGGPNLSSQNYFGLDPSARDLYARVVIGTRISLMVGIVGALVSVIVGTIWGATAGYVGGRVDSVMMRIVDVMMSIPFMFVLILLLVVFGRSIVMLFVGIGLISWLDMARIVRGQTLSIKNQEYVEAAIAIGVSTPTIIRRHVIPNLLGVVIVYATLLIPSMIIFESFISFLGLGVQEPATSWGALISEGVDQMRYGAWWTLAFPLGFFVVTIFAFFFMGDGLRDALDPKDR